MSAEILLQVGMLLKAGKASFIIFIAIISVDTVKT
jgi:hypothetical protein